jgi:hypothetical protein
MKYNVFDEPDPWDYEVPFSAREDEGYDEAVADEDYEDDTEFEEYTNLWEEFEDYVELEEYNDG